MPLITVHNISITHCVKHTTALHHEVPYRLTQYRDIILCDNCW